MYVYPPPGVRCDSAFSLSRLSAPFHIPSEYMRVYAPWDGVHPTISPPDKLDCVACVIDPPLVGRKLREFAAGGWRESSPPPAPGRGFREVGRLQWATGAERGISRQVPHLSWEPGMAVGCMRSLDGAWRGGSAGASSPPQGARYILCWGCRLGAEYARARFLR